MIELDCQWKSSGATSNNHINGKGTNKFINNIKL